MRRSLILVSLLVACSPAGSEPEGSPHGVRAIVGARSVALRSDGFVSRGGTVVSIGARTPDDALHSLAVSAPSFADEPMSIALASRGGSGTRIALAPLGLRHVPWKLESGTLVAEDVQTSVDALWSADVTRAELFYVLRDARAPRAFRFALDANELEVESEGTIAIREGERVAMRIPRPFAIDAAGVRRDAGMRLDGKELVIELDTSGLAFPIVLDPGVETATWTKIGGSDRWPRMRYCAGEIGGKLVRFGGLTNSSNSSAQGDTWELSGTTWTKKLPATSPEPRFDCLMAPLGGKLVMFGGFPASGGPLNDTWVWDGASWTKLTTPSAPPFRRWGAFVSTGTEIVLFGGETYTGVTNILGDTWRFDGAAWSQYTGPAPAARTYIRVAGRVAGGALIAGGDGGSPYPFYDTWIWNGGWTKKADSGFPGSPGFTDGTKAYLGPGVGGTSSVFDGGSSWVSTASAFSGPLPNVFLIHAAYVTTREPSAHAGESGAWAVTESKGAGWAGVQRITNGIFTDVADESAVPVGALANEKGVLTIVRTTATSTDRITVWRRSGTTFTPTTSAWNPHAPTNTPLLAAEAGSKLHVLECGSSSGVFRRLDGTAWTSLAAPSCSGVTASPADAMIGLPSGEVFFNGQRFDGTAWSTVGAPGPMASFKNEAWALAPAGTLHKWTSGTWTAVPATGTPTGVQRIAASGNRLVALTASGIAIWNGTAWRTLAASGGPPAIKSFVGVGSKFHASWASELQRPDPSGQLWSLDIGYDDGTACTLATDCTSGFCTNGVCCNVASCGAGSSCSTATAKGTCRKLDGQACGAAAECGSGFCAGGSCCKTACSTTTHTCSAAGKAGTCLKLLGQAASSGAECASGFVADGVCCDTACTGKCTSCKAVDTGGADGTCAAIPEGKDPASECPDPADVNSCGPDGLCDGKGACRTFAPEGKTCGSATCASGEIAGNICNGSGACVVSKKDCAPYVCAADAKSCLGACTSDADCKDKSMRCNVAGVCVARAKNGDACAAASECESKHCVDGVCCNNACDGQCQACNLAGSAGTCSAVKGEPVGGRAACNGAGTPCAGACDGVAATCSYPSIGTDCGSTCTAGTYVEKKCDNKGSCAEKTPVSCNLYACSATGCKDRCDTAADCASSEVDCKDGRCVPHASASCADDGVTLIESDGTQKDCTPRRCAGGTCIETCVRSDTDCASGYLCSEGTCVPRPAEAIDSGCGCAVPGRTSRASEAVAIALALLALRRRSSRPRRGGPHVERTLRRRSR